MSSEFLSRPLFSAAKQEAVDCLPLCLTKQLGRLIDTAKSLFGRGVKVTSVSYSIWVEAPM